ncbi:PEGA domain-containing protein [Pyxidicoccus xibeiensis]|uniref:PEGA domain-containing protein n=1 Tax=Pyxidicoccus xibeiensis TaxID=2906759 RepID=UPI0020A7CBE5|nr:PEGA domain-containing protein [Pyxidicoccus xibeiensis]MCP3141383.1 PEGA domain-containing protein [Pyxidicoccus xibeiensis]
MNTFRRFALLLALLLAFVPAHAQTTRKKATRKKAAVTKVVKKKKGKKTKAPPVAEETAETTEVAPTEPMVFGEGEPEKPAEPAKPVAPSDKPAVATPAPVAPAPTPVVMQKPTLPAALTASGPVALFAVARTPAAADAAVKLEAELLGHLRKGSGVELVDLGLAFPPPEPAPLTKADTLFEEGRTAYDNLDPEAAEAKFRAAAEAYVQSPGQLSPERLSQAYVFLGASRMLNGDAAGAKAAFRSAVEAQPSNRPDAALFGQDVQKAFEDARAEVTARPAGKLVVDSQPAGAQVLVGGRELGVTPLKGVDVPAGPHPVVVQLPGYAPYAQYAEVKSAASTEVKAKLEPTPGLSAIREAATRGATEAAFDQDAPPPEVRAIGERLDARYVVLAAVTKDKKGRNQAELQAWDLKSKARLRGVEIELAARDGKRSPSAAADQVRGFVNGAMAPRVSEKSGSGDSLLKRPWFWAAVGGAAAVAAGTVYVVTQQPGGRYNPITGGVGF